MDGRVDSYDRTTVTDETSILNNERLCMKHVLFFIVVTASAVASADGDFYVKRGNDFVKVEKTEAVLAILQKHETVLKCSEQRLTKKLTLKAVSKSDD